MHSTSYLNTFIAVAPDSDGQVHAQRLRAASAHGRSSHKGSTASKSLLTRCAVHSRLLPTRLVDGVASRLVRSLAR